MFLCLYTYIYEKRIDSLLKMVFVDFFMIKGPGFYVSPEYCAISIPRVIIPVYPVQYYRENTCLFLLVFAQFCK